VPGPADPEPWPGLARTVLSEISTEGIAIEAVVDHSGSMRAEMDYDREKLDRLEVVKRVLKDFIEGDKGTPNALFRVGDPKKGLGGRTGDLIGLVTFARYADTVCPLVLSHGVVTEFLRQTQIVNPRSNEDGTAIGDAIALGAARLKKAEEEIQRRSVQLRFGGEGGAQAGSAPGFAIKSKIMLLLTDGIDNASRYKSPLEAADLAKQWGIKIYTIGIGSGQGYVTMPGILGDFRVPVREELDERLLKAIAERTGGFYGRADDADALRKIVKKIDELEKTEVKSVQYVQYAEHFGWWTLPAPGRRCWPVALSFGNP
jgi:Ca-activated chloride channel family protein